MKISVGFSTSRSVFARLTRWSTRSEVSHVFFLLEDSFLGADMVLEADPPDVHLRPLETFARENRIVELFGVPAEVELGLRSARTWLGRSYDYGALFGMSFVLLGRWLRRRWQNPWNSRRALDCCELVVRALSIANYPEIQTLGSGDGLSPQDLLEFFRNQRSRLRQS